jgi:hypothetical protein
MSDYIKSLDSNHLVGVGDEGFFNEPGHPDLWYNGFFGVDWESVLEIPTIDFGTVHVYPEHWEKDLPWTENWITEHINRGQAIGKPVVFEEFGICGTHGDQPYCNPAFNRNEIYAVWTDLFESGAAGDLVWMIAGKVNGCNEEHVAINGNCYYPNYDGFTFWEPISVTMCIIRSHAARMQNKNPNVCNVYLPLVVGGSGPPPIPTPTSTSTTTMTPIPTHTATSTSTPTSTPMATHTPTPTPTPIPAFDFEGDCQGWGKQPYGQTPQPCQGVTPSTEVAYTGNYSLRFDDLGPYASNTTQDVGIIFDAYDTRITVYIFLPGGVPSFPAVIYIQDQNWGWNQSSFVNLVPGEWVSVSFDTQGQQWPTPYRTLGVHFTPGTYTGPIYIDTVIIEQ